ncbi:MAG TPA: glycosyltransferase family 87 protein, partial [Candidatus Limnocylindrales bacterium]
RVLAIAFVAVAAALLLEFLAAYFTRGFIPGDATVYLAGGERLNAGHQVYALMPGDRPEGFKPPYWTVPLLSPPLVAVIFRPLALLPNDIGAYIWWAGCLAAFAGILYTFVRRQPILTSLVVMALVVPLTYEIGVGNMNAFLLLGAILAWKWMAEGRDERAGVVTALGFVLKVSPVVLAWWIFTQWRWRAVRAGLVAGAAFLGISILGAGLDAHLTFIQVTRDTATVGQSDLSLAGLAKAIGMAPAIANLIPAAMLLGGVLGVFLLRDRPNWAFALAVATMTLGSPVVNINSYAMLLGCLAPWIWPLPEPVAALAPAAPPGDAEPRTRPLTA